MIQIKHVLLRFINLQLIEAKTMKVINFNRQQKTLYG